MDGMQSSFNPKKMALLFGGRFDKQKVAVLPMQFEKVTNTCSPVNDNNLLMYYHNSCYHLMMPCGQLADLSQDDDEQDII